MNGQQIIYGSGSASVRLAPEAYPLIRSALAMEYAELPAEDLESLLARNGINAEAMEGIFDDFSRAVSGAAKAVSGVVKQAAPIVANVAGRALPGIISGATTGAALGPWGALGGALLGGVTSAVSGGKPGAPGAGGAAGGPLGAITGALPALAGLAGGGGNPALAAMQVLKKPEFVQMLMSSALGQLGKPAIPMGANGTPVPSSIAGTLLNVLGQKIFAQAEANSEPSEAMPQYLYKDGQLAVDPAEPEQRAARALELMSETTWTRPVQTRGAGPVYTEADEYYDAIDIAEMEAMDIEAEEADEAEGALLDVY